MCSAQAYAQSQDGKPSDLSMSVSFLPLKSRSGFSLAHRSPFLVRKTMSVRSVDPASEATTTQREVCDGPRGRDDDSLVIGGRSLGRALCA